MSEDINYKINITNNPAGVQQAAAGLVKVEQEAADLRSQFSSVEKAAVRASKAVSNVGDAKPLRQATSEIKRAEAAMRDYGAAAKQAGDEVKSFADFKANVGQLSGALNFAGLGSVGGGLGIAQQAAASVEALGKIGPALGEMSNKAVEGSKAAKAFAGGLDKAIPGLSSTGANLVTLGAAGLLAGGAIAAVAIAWNKFSDESKATADILRAAAEARRELNQAIVTGQITEADAIAQRDQLLAKIQAEIDLRNELQAAYDAAEAKLGPILSAVGRVISSAEQELVDQIDKSSENINSWQGEVDELNRALERGAFATNNAAEAEERYRQIQVTSINNAAAVQQQLLAAQNQSSEAIRNQISTLNEQVKIYQNQALALRNAGEDVTALNAKIDEMGTLALRLETETLPLITAQERAAETAEKAAEAQEELARQQAETTDMLIAATEKYNSDVERINQQTYQKLAALQENYNQAQINAAQKLVDDQTKITERLADTVAKLAQEASKADADARRNLELNRAKELLNFQRAEQDAARDHLRRMQQIRKDAEASEEEAILNRDFRALFQIRKRTTEQLKSETENFGEERRKRSEQIQQRLGDMAAEFAQEQAQRHQEYQQRLADAKAQSDKERQQVDADNKAALDKLSAHFQAQQALIKRQQEQEIASRNKAIESELQVISQGYERRLQIERQYQERMIQQAQSILSRSGGLVGANGGSSLSGAAGNRYNSVVNNNASMNNSFAINSSNPTVTSQTISKVLMAQLSDIFGP